MNRPRWKLLVEGLGKIERAEVEVHPLMLFVGDNNSGKSYLASVLWGLLAMRTKLPPPGGATLSALEAWLDARRTEFLDRPSTHPLSPDERALLTQLFNERVRREDALVKLVFNSPVMTVSRIEVEPLHHDALQIVAHGAPKSPGVGGTAFHFDPRTDDARWAGTREVILETLASQVVFGVAHTLIGDEPIFLPASRSGFMLLYQAAARRGFERAVLSGSAGELKMTRPAYQFIDMLAFGMKTQEGPHAPEAALLEGDLGGRVELISGPVGINDFTYHPIGSANLHLSLASSLVTELAPIILVLRHMSGFPVLVLEEPEAHLHPRLQRRLAQVIVRLVRKGLYVWVTTHSENFCQQINNFMKIGAVADRAKLRDEMQKSLGYAYDEQDYLTPEDVAGYEFVNQGERSVVRELEKYPDGLVMPTFNREMVAISREVTFLEDHLDEGS